VRDDLRLREQLGVAIYAGHPEVTTHSPIASASSTCSSLDHAAACEEKEHSPLRRGE
jgi:hypothetical protein